MNVELADNIKLIRRGLMHRAELANDAGMLFLMGREKPHRFWMKDTLIPLDIIFIGQDLTVVGVLADMAPRSTVPRGVGEPSLYVLEVNAGWAAAHQVARGAPVRFENLVVRDR